MIKRNKDTLTKIKTYVKIGIFLIGAPIVVNKLSNKYSTPYSNDQIKLSEKEINEIKETLLPELIERVPSSKLTDENIDNYFLLNAIYENDQLDEEIKNYFYDLLPIIEENSYLNKKGSYITLNDLEYIQKEKPEEVEENVLAQFLPVDNLIEYFYSKNNDLQYNIYLLHHESIHAVFDQNPPLYFHLKDTEKSLKEGITELLNREYLGNDPYSMYNGVYDNYNYIYIPNIISVKLLCDLIGSDKVLEAYTKGDQNIIYEALENIKGTKKEAETFIKNLDDILYTFAKNNYKTLKRNPEIENTINQFREYQNELIKINKDKIKIKDQLIFDYNLTILRYMYGEKDWSEEYWQLVHEIGVPEKAYFCEELKNKSRNTIVEYKDRKLCLNRDFESTKTLVKRK